MTVEADFSIPGLPAGRGWTRGRRIRLRLASDSELDRAWSPAEAETISVMRNGNGVVAQRVDRHETLGYLLDAPGYGRFLMSSDGSRVACAPAPTDRHHWQLVLTGQVLPFAATLQGLEVFHASAASFGGRAIMLLGSSGAGKSTVAATLALAGASFLADDVVAVEEREGVPLAHPGLSLAKLLPEVHDVVFAGVAGRVGTPIDGGAKTQLDLGGEPRLTPPGAMYFLERLESGPPSIERLDAPDPRLLLGSTFNFCIQTPDRLRRQLDICSLLATQVPAFRGRAAAGDAPALAQLIADHKEGVLGAVESLT